jgi:hypothetical protein
LAYSDAPLYIGTLSENDRNTIPKAFGFMVPAPPPASRVNTTQEIIPDPPIIGSIRGGGTHIVFYRDISDGRIRIRENR